MLRTNPWNTKQDLDQSSCFYAADPSYSLPRDPVGDWEELPCAPSQFSVIRFVKPALSFRGLQITLRCSKMSPVTQGSRLLRARSFLLQGLTTTHEDYTTRFHP
jgi:hypothetical protein